MSGFAGLVNAVLAGAGREPDRAPLQRMAQAIAFRGPDGESQRLLPGAGFAFALLRTGPAPQEATQPCSLNGESWLAGDVRCDGRPDLRARLAQHGCELPQSATSETLVLQALARFGPEHLDRLEGDLSFAVWSTAKRQLLAYRDLNGARPFFYSVVGDTLFFSNTLQAVLAGAQTRPQWDDEFLANFLLGAPHHDPERTVYRSVRRLPAGHLLEFSARGLEVRRIAQVPVDELLHLRGDQEYAEAFNCLLDQAIADRLPYAPASILLSGGLDSTTIAARAMRLRARDAALAVHPFRALAIDFKPVLDDPEAEIASRLAAALSLPCEVVHSGASLPYEDWDSGPLFPEPLPDPYSQRYFWYHREIGRSSRVAFTGGGGDESLRLRAKPYLQYLARTQGALAPALAVARYVLREGKLPALGAGLRGGVQRLFGAQEEPSGSFPPWIKGDFADRLDLRARWQAINAEPASAHPYNPRAHAAANDPAMAIVLEMMDPTWTGTHVETRFPFLDRRLTRFLLRLPVIPWAMDKRLLRYSQAGILPEEIRLRKKTPVPEDILVLHAASKPLGPFPGEPPDELKRVTEWPLVLENLKCPADSSLHVHLRPVSLARWLKRIEKAQSIQ